jgi:hypothetical protein
VRDHEFQQSFITAFLPSGAEVGQLQQQAGMMQSAGSAFLITQFPF